AKRIDQHRKENLVVRVRDADGQPVPDVSIHVDQTTHAFRFGTAINNWRLFPDKPRDGLDTYRELIPRHFNQGTLENGHKWTTWERRREQAIDTVAWLRERDMTVRGHVLLWPSWRAVPKHLREFEN